MILKKFIIFTLGQRSKHVPLSLHSTKAWLLPINRSQSAAPPPRLVIQFIDCRAKARLSPNPFILDANFCDLLFTNGRRQHTAAIRAPETNRKSERHYFVKKLLFRQTFSILLLKGGTYFLLFCFIKQ